MFSSKSIHPLYARIDPTSHDGVGHAALVAAGVALGSGEVALVVVLVVTPEVVVGFAQVAVLQAADDRSVVSADDRLESRGIAVDNALRVKAVCCMQHLLRLLPREPLRPVQW